MILVMHSPGQLGNKLFLFAYFIAFGIEHRRTVVNLSFDPYEKYFSSMCHARLCPFPSYSPDAENIGGHPKGWTKRIDAQPYFRRVYLGLAWRAFHASGRMGWRRLVNAVSDEHRSRHWDLSGQEFIALASRTRVLMVDGWLFRDRSGLQKHADAIRQFFVPIEPHRSAAASIAARARRDASLLVGVHIRRGDYRTFLDGRYFYEFDQYAAIMRKIVTLYESGRRVSFLICSDEPVPTEPFRGLNINFGSGQMIEDMHALAKCDLLVGPWSTFSGWASFYGSVPWYKIDDPSAEPAVSSFRSLHEVWASE
jgi:hypothetical protein